MNHQRELQAAANRGARRGVMIIIGIFAVAFVCSSLQSWYEGAFTATSDLIWSSSSIDEDFWMNSGIALSPTDKPFSGYLMAGKLSTPHIEADIASREDRILLAVDEHLRTLQTNEDRVLATNIKCPSKTVALVRVTDELLEDIAYLMGRSLLEDRLLQWEVTSLDAVHLTSGVESTFEAQDLRSFLDSWQGECAEVLNVTHAEVLNLVISESNTVTVGGPGLIERQGL